MTNKIIVIGGGPSGLMAAIAAASQGGQVLLLDKGDKLGRKLAISGGGRCNVTNRISMEEMIRHIPGNGRFMYSPFSVFNNEDIIRFFEDLGIKLKEEDNGRMFPQTDKAKTVVEVLLKKLHALGVQIKVNTPVKRILYDFEQHQVKGLELMNGEELYAKKIIVAVGGKSVPQTGSTGDGYAWAEQAGHRITSLFPTEVPITSSEVFIQNRSLQGLSLRNVQLSVINQKRKKVISHQGDLLFTHFGLSGPIALRCSQFVVKELVKLKKGKQQVELQIDIFPNDSLEAVRHMLQQRLELESKKALKNVFKSVIPERLLPILFERASLDVELTYAQLPKLSFQGFVEGLKAFSIVADGTLSIEEAFVTGGGVDVKEIDPKSMQSKLMKGLYFCGEILDIHGYTGGYNITCAFSTGYTAGRHAASQ
jgi:predicted Rossmann fold flavoprotein